MSLSFLQSQGENTRIVLKNSASAFIVKGLSLIVGFFAVPAYMRFFDNNTVLGVWYTVLSVLTWVLSFDLGIGNGIRNNLVRSFANNDELESKRIVSSGMFVSLCFSLFVLLVGCGLLYVLNLHSLFHLSAETISREALFHSAVCVLSAIALRFFLTTISSLFYAAQKSRINNYIALAVSILQLSFVLLFKFDNQETALVALSASFIITSNLPSIVAAFIAFKGRYKFCSPSISFVRKEIVIRVLSVGGVFFICQILYMIIMNTNEFFITRYYGAECTVEYTLYYKLTSLVSMIVTLALTPIWSVVTKAQEEHDYLWLGKLYHYLKLAVLVTSFLQILMAVFLRPLMALWLGNRTIDVDLYTSMVFALFGISFVYSTVLSTIVCGLERMKLQLVCYLIGVALKIVVIIICSKTIDSWTLVVWMNIIVFLPYSILQQIDLNRFFKKAIIT